MQEKDQSRETASLLDCLCRLAEVEECAHSGGRATFLITSMSSSIVQVAGESELDHPQDQRLPHLLLRLQGLCTVFFGGGRGRQGLGQSGFPFSYLGNELKELNTIPPALIGPECKQQPRHPQDAEETLMMEHTPILPSQHCWF